MLVGKRFLKFLLRLILIGVLVSPIYPLRYLFAGQGELICGSEQHQQAPSIAYADAESYLIVWEDYRSGSSFDIYGAGSNDGAKFGPIPICTVSRDQRNPVVAWNGSHYLVIWEDNRNGSFFDIYGMRVSKGNTLLDGTVSSGGRSVSIANGDQLHPDIIWNAKDCFFVVWEDHRNSDADIYGTRISADFALYDGPATDGGIALCAKMGDQKSPCVGWNGSNFFVVWEDHVSAEVTDIRGLRLSPAGNILDETWEGGLAISVDNNIQRNPDVASNGSGYFVVWDTHTTEDGYPNIYGIAVTGSGVIANSGPIPVSDAVNNQVNPTINWTGNNYICLWKDDRDGIVDVYWTRINSEGQLLNTDTVNGGMAFNLTSESCIFTSPAAGFTQGEGLIIWDEENVSHFDIYAVKLSPPMPPTLEWTKEAGYESDGVEPDTGFGGETFIFRVLYKDLEDTPPQIAQVWIDSDGDGDFIFPGDLKVDMAVTPGVTDPDYKTGVVYQAEVLLEYEWDEEIYYYFYFKDDIDNASGAPTNISTMRIKNNPPVLSWPDISGYFSDGVDPNQAEGSFTFMFMINYLDIEGDLPEIAEVWIDLDDNGSFEQRERFVMFEADQEDIQNGRNYKKSVKILYVGDGKLNYKFLFADSDNLAVGNPTKNHTLVVMPHLRVPILSWPVGDGFKHGARLGNSSDEDLVVFKIGYCDFDNDPPVTAQVWVDLNGDGSFTSDEKLNMSPENTQNVDYVKVNYYEKQITVTYSGDKEIFYKFMFDDGWNIATGEPFLEGGTIILESPVYLLWPNDIRFEDDGVYPNEGYKGNTFEFRIVYTNENGYPPVLKEVWLDENLDGEYQSNERYRMEDANAEDVDYKNGKEYFKRLEFNGEGIGLIPYKFVFSDTYMNASGEPSEAYPAIQIIPGSNSGDPYDNGDPAQNPYADGMSLEAFDSLGKGCFINAASQDLFCLVEVESSEDLDMLNPSKQSLDIWVKMVILGLVVLIIMGGILIVFLYKHCEISGK